MRRAERPSLPPGEIVLQQATRSFSVRADHGRTLKEVLLRRRAQGPPPVPALMGVDLHVGRGERVGMVGRNGAGKTSTLRVLAGIIPLHSGLAACGGRVIAVLELGAGFSRDFTGRENIYLQGALHGVGRAELEQRVEGIIAFSELGSFIEAPVKTYSAGMLLRLGFSIAAHLDADVLLIDEVLAVGDEAFQRKCLRRISEHITRGATVLLVSHDPAAIERVCERVVVLDGGQVVFDGPTAEGLLHYHRLMGTEHGGGQSLRGPGQLPLEVVEVELRDVTGRVCSTFRSGGAMQVLVGLRAHAGLSRPAVEIELSCDGVALSRTVHELDLAEPTAQVAFEVPSLSLLGGDYDLALRAGEAGALGARQRAVRFAVAHDPGREEGIIDLHGSWRSLAGAERVG